MVNLAAGLARLQIKSVRRPGDPGPDKERLEEGCQVNQMSKRLKRLFMTLAILLSLTTMRVSAQPSASNTAEAEGRSTYIVVFKGVPPFQPRTPRALLSAFNEDHPPGVRTSYFRTEVSGDALIGRICVDGADGKAAVLRMLEDNSRLTLVECIAATPEIFEKHVALKQVSLPGTAAQPEQERPALKSVEETDKLLLEFALRDHFGREVRSSDYRGAPVLIMAGACWCGGCQQDAEPLRAVAEQYGPRGLGVIRSVSGDNELASLEFQRHYRLPFVQLLDPSREFEKRYNRNGWTFLMLADAEGHVVYRLNGPREADWQALRERLDKMLPENGEGQRLSRDGVSYLPATLERSGETDRLIQRDRFPSLACDSDGRLYLVFTTNRNGNSDVFLRVYDGEQWQADRPVAATEADEFDGAVTVDKGNRVWVSWTSNADGAKYNIFVAASADVSKPLEHKRITNSEDDAMHARLAASADGRIWVVYYKWHKMGGRSRDKEVYVRCFDGADWSSEAQVSPADVPIYEDHTDPFVAANGDAAVIGWSWDYHRPQGYTKVPREPSIFCREVGADSKLGPVRAVSGANIDTMPAVAVCSDGRLWCAWESVTWDRVAGANRKMICAASLDKEQEDRPRPGKNVSGLQRNVCTPSLAVSPSGVVTLVWAQADVAGRWTLNRAEYESADERWSRPVKVLSEGGPRFPTACYAPNGDLWIACSVASEEGRSIAVVCEK